MHRRQLLTAGSGAGLVGFAGCLDAAEPDADGPNDDGAGDEPNADNGDDATVGEATVDDPPYNIERPDDGAEWDEWNHDLLGEHMPTTPSLEYETLDAEADVEVQPLDDLDREYESAYAVGLVTTPDREDEVFDRDPAAGPLVDYDASLLAVVHSGYGSSSLDHRWGRVEETNDGIHLHGYYSHPPEQTDDLAVRRSVVRVERPADHDQEPIARVSLTVSSDERVTFDSVAPASIVVDDD